MFCPNCGKEIDDKAVICVGCGVPVTPAKKAEAAPGTKKFSTLQIVAFVLFGVQLIVLIISGLQNMGVIAYSLGFMVAAIVGFILLFLDYKKKHGANAPNEYSAPTEGNDAKDSERGNSPLVLTTKSAQPEKAGYELIFICSAVIAYVGFLIIILSGSI